MGSNPTIDTPKKKKSQAPNTRVATMVGDESNKFRTHLEIKAETPRREPGGFRLLNSMGC